jgi:glycosyltransferase involved in cell wall biosynthesis
MARIAFFTESLPPSGDVIGRFAWDLIYSLANQQHEIRVFSTYRSEHQILPPSHPRIEILRPFRKWGLLELPKILPSLMSFRPEVIHVIQPHDESLMGLTNAMDLLPALKPVLGKPALIASFFDVSEKNFKKHRVLLSQVDAITVSNREQQDLFTNYFLKIGDQPLLEVVPLGFARASENASLISADEIVIDESSGSEHLDNLLLDYPNIIAVGGPIESHKHPQTTFKALALTLGRLPNTAAVILGGWGPLPIRLRHECEQILFDHGVQARVLLTGKLDEIAETSILKRARCVLSAPISEARLAYTRFIRAVQHVGKPLVMSTEQAELDPIRWRNNENALVSKADEFGMSQALSVLIDDNETCERLSRNLTELSRTAVADQPGNLVSRLYVKALNTLG